jgi:hypothetical protein
MPKYYASAAMSVHFLVLEPCSDQSAMTHIHLLRDIEYLKFAHLQTIFKRTDGLIYL